MADASDEKLARMLEQHKDRPWYAWADIVTNGEVVMMVTELQARRAADAGSAADTELAEAFEQLERCIAAAAPCPTADGRSAYAILFPRKYAKTILARRAAEAKAVEVDLPDYLRFGEPDMFPPAQK